MTLMCECRKTVLTELLYITSRLTTYEVWEAYEESKRKKEKEEKVKENACSNGNRVHGQSGAEEIT